MFSPFPLPAPGLVWNSLSSYVAAPVFILLINAHLPHISVEESTVMENRKAPMDGRMDGWMD